MADINSLNTAVADKNTIKKIYNGEFEIETFDYDGIKYSALDAYPLITFLETEIAIYNENLNKRDALLFKFFLNKAVKQNNLKDFKAHSLSYFMQTSTPFDQIIENMVQVKKMEEPFKNQLSSYWNMPFIKSILM